MAITATQIESSNSLEQFRQEFNNLQSDVTGLENGTITFSTITTTSQNTTTLNVREDGTITFEGATDDGFETTLTVVDPTADRTLSLPNETGTIFTSGTTANTLITGQTTIASGAVASSADELLLSDASAGTRTVCKTETRYSEESKTMYSHSTIKFEYHGKIYTLKFKK